MVVILVPDLEHVEERCDGYLLSINYTSCVVRVARTPNNAARRCTILTFCLVVLGVNRMINAALNCHPHPMHARPIQDAAVSKEIIKCVEN